jgi:pyruvate dehydrogenase E1 component alpha subunit
MHRVVGERSIAGASEAATARTLLAEMIRARVFDDRALALQRRGWMSGYPPFRGQEASQVGAATALTADDWLFPTYRANALQLARGVPTTDLLLFRRGHPEFHSDHDLPVFPQAVPIATQLPHAVGVGMAADYHGADHAVLAYLGDGATSEGDFHEAMNVAGVFDAPVLFFCENNGWAISTPRERQTAAPSIAAKADAYGFEGRQVDGNDPLAVREVVADVLDRVPSEGPTLVESLTYRRGPHTTSDDPDRYRDDPGLPEWRTRDPIDRFAEYCREEDVVDERFRDRARDGAERAVDRAVAAAEAVPVPDPSDVFDAVSETLPPRLAAQRKAVRDRHGGE